MASYLRDDYAYVLVFSHVDAQNLWQRLFKFGKQSVLIKNCPIF